MKIVERSEELTFQIYIAEAVRLHAENKTLSVRLQDILIPPKNRIEKSAEEVKAGIIAEFERINGGGGNGGGD